MRIAVIAANGRLGKSFVAEALRSGHSVRAGVRDKHDFEPHANLQIVKCDATNADDLRLLCRDVDAVVSAIGHVKGSPAAVQTIATQQLILIMNELGLDRFVDVTGTGVRFDGDKISVVDRVLNSSIEMIDRNRIIDGRNHQEVLKNSNLRWTTIRVLKLQNSKPTPYTLRLHGPTKWYVARKEVAMAICEVLAQDSFIQQAPIIARP